MTTADEPQGTSDDGKGISSTDDGSGSSTDGRGPGSPAESQPADGAADAST